MAAPKPKLSKDDIQKIALGALMFCVLIYVYFTMMLAPLSASEKKFTTEAVALREKIREADLEIRKAKNLEAQALPATEMVAALRESTPKGLPIAWYPVRLMNFFKNQGLDDPLPTIQLASETPGIDSLQGFIDIQWNVNFERAPFTKFGHSMAALENENPLVQINNIGIVASTEQPEFQRVTLVFTDLLPGPNP